MCLAHNPGMAGVYDEVEIGDLDFDEEELMYYYPCPCGDKFFIGLEDLWDGEDIAGCPSCTLMIRVLFEEADLPPLPSDDDEDYEDEDEATVEQGETQKVGVQAEFEATETAETQKVGVQAEFEATETAETTTRADDDRGESATRVDKSPITKNAADIDFAVKAQSDGQ